MSSTTSTLRKSLIRTTATTNPRSTINYHRRQSIPLISRTFVVCPLTTRRKSSACTTTRTVTARWFLVGWQRAFCLVLVTFAQNETYRTLKDLLDLQPKTASAGENRDLAIEKLAKDVLARVPKPIPLGPVMEKYPVMYEQVMPHGLPSLVRSFVLLV